MSAIGHVGIRSTAALSFAALAAASCDADGPGGGGPPDLFGTVTLIRSG